MASVGCLRKTCDESRVSFELPHKHERVPYIFMVLHVHTNVFTKIKIGKREIDVLSTVKINLIILLNDPKHQF